MVERTKVKEITRYGKLLDVCTSPKKNPTIKLHVRWDYLDFDTKQMKIEMDF
jgi:hypothetical protein